MVRRGNSISSWAVNASAAMNHHKNVNSLLRWWLANKGCIMIASNCLSQPSKKHRESTPILHNLTQTMTSPSLSLVTLPSELHLKIFDTLDTDPGAAACLGVTCKTFYPLFRARKHTIDLFGFTGCTKCLEGGLQETSHPGPACKLLYMLLADWMGPRYFWRILSNKFVTKERYRELDFVEARRRQDKKRRGTAYSGQLQEWTNILRQEEARRNASQQ